MRSADGGDPSRRGWQNRPLAVVCLWCPAECGGFADLSARAEVLCRYLWRQPCHAWRRSGRIAVDRRGAGPGSGVACRGHAAFHRTANCGCRCGNGAVDAGAVCGDAADCADLVVCADPDHAFYRVFLSDDCFLCAGRGAGGTAWQRRPSAAGGLARNGRADRGLCSGGCANGADAGDATPLQWFCNRVCGVCRGRGVFDAQRMGGSFPTCPRLNSFWRGVARRTRTQSAGGGAV